jgi:cellulase/cellobiase CelA1
MTGRGVRIRRLAAAALTALIAVAVFAVGVPPAAVRADGPAPAESPGAARCAVVYTVQAQWATGFLGGITVTNIGTVPVRWRVSLRYLPGQGVVQAYGAVVGQDGDAVTMTGGYPWNSVLMPGQSVTISFVGRHPGHNPPPVVTCEPA